MLLNRPKPLPFQLLDHATGWLAAYAAVTGLQQLFQEGDGSVVGVSLAQTAHWLMRVTALPASEPAPDAANDHTVESRSVFGQLTHVRPLCPWPDVPSTLNPPTDLSDTTLWWDEVS